MCMTHITSTYPLQTQGIELLVKSVNIPETPDSVVSTSIFSLVFHSP